MTELLLCKAYVSFFVKNILILKKLSLNLND